MNHSLTDRYRSWFEYEKDSHVKTLSSLNAVPEQQRNSREFRKAVYLMGHIVAARRMWLFRFSAGEVRETWLAYLFYFGGKRDSNHLEFVVTVLRRR